MSIKKNQKKKPSNSWYQSTLSEVVKKLKTSKKGLSEKESKARIKQYGANVIAQAKKLSRLRIFVRQFANTFTYILLLAAIISWYLGEHVDSMVILLAVALNVIVGFFQENKANTALQNLRSIIKYNVKVFRDGELHECDSSELVPGDSIELEAGDRVPADSRVVEILSQFKVNEALLTGESLPTEKRVSVVNKKSTPGDQQNMVFAGTLVTTGRAIAIVVETGMHTEIGKIAQSIKEIKEISTPLQKGLEKFSKKVGLLVLAIAILIFAVGVLSGSSIGHMFTLSVALSVAAIPEGLIVAVTVILAIGMQRILKEGSLVRKLVASETLGSTTVICTDKTGTLTEGKMRVVHIVTASHQADMLKKSHKELDGKAAGQELQEMLKIGVLNNNSFIDNPEAQFEHIQIKGSPTEAALLYAALNVGVDTEAVQKEEPRHDEIPFDSKSKYMITLHAKGKENVLYIKGAPEKIFENAPHVLVGNKPEVLSKAKKKELELQIKEYSKQGLRLLACGYKSVGSGKGKIQQLKAIDNGYTLVGLFAMKDPLRKDTKKTIKQCIRAGMKPVMMTGDHKLTAQAIAKELNLPTQKENIIEGGQLDALTDADLVDRLKTVSVYARVTPEHKLRIVQALQAEGEVVAMTGDGVNDAPALKKADIGIALGSGTDVSKGAADMVLLDNRFSTIIRAISEGRTIYENIRKVILYLLTDSFSEVVLILSSFLLHLPLPLLPAQILWINLITDGLPDLALTFEPGDPDVLNDPPRDRNEPVVTKPMKKVIFLGSVITGLMSLLGFYVVYRVTQDEVFARSVTFAMLGVDSLFYVFSLRSLRAPIWRSNILANKFLLGAVGLGFVLQVVSLYEPHLQKLLNTVPLHPAGWILVVGHGIVVLMLIELMKLLLVTPHYHKKRGASS